MPPGMAAWPVGDPLHARLSRCPPSSGCLRDTARACRVCTTPTRQAVGSSWGRAPQSMAEGLHFRLPGGFLEVLVNITAAVSRKEKKMWRRSPKVLRHAVMAFFFLFLLHVAFDHQVKGGGPRGTPSVEAYCPFGGLENAYQFLTTVRRSGRHHRAHLASGRLGVSRLRSIPGLLPPG